MRFYILPKEQETTTCINFDQVAYIRITGPSIEIFFLGLETPMVIAKSPATLGQIAKGMDLSEATKDQVSRL